MGGMNVAVKGKDSGCQRGNGNGNGRMMSLNTVVYINDDRHEGYIVWHQQGSQ